MTEPSLGLKYLVSVLITMEDNRYEINERIKATKKVIACLEAEETDAP